MRSVSFLLLSCLCLGTQFDVFCQVPTDKMDVIPNREKDISPGSKIYFKAVGDDPDWTLAISPHGIEFRIQSTGYGNFSSPHVEPVKAMDSNIKLYKLRTAAGSMDIELTNMPCQNDLSRERFTYTVNMTYQQGIDTSVTYFNGCGKYITEPDLEHKWVLQEINSDTVTAAQFNDTLPYLLIYSRASSFEGYGGCNTINGRLFSERNMVRFTNLYLSKRKCVTIAKEEEFVKALQFSTQFEIIDHRLVLSNYNGVTMVLTKVEK